jgi:transcriptional regulator with XRE-family HTH domain
MLYMRRAQQMPNWIVLDQVRIGNNMTETLTETFGGYITRLRAAVGVSKSELARRVGVTRGYIGFIEADSQPPTGDPPNVGEDILRKLAQHLSVSEREMFDRGYRAPKDYALVPIEYVADPAEQLVVEAYRNSDSRGKRHIESAAEVALETSRVGAYGRRAE